MSNNLINIYTKDLKELDIDESLNRKIIKNEGKFHALFNVLKKNKKIHSTDEKGIIRERNQKNNKYKKHNQTVIMDNTKNNSLNNSINNSNNNPINKTINNSIIKYK